MDSDHSAAVAQRSLPEVDFVSIPDVLLRNPRLAHSLRFPVLGMWTRFETNSRYVCDVIHEAFASWERLHGDAERPPSTELRVRIVVHEGTEHGTGHALVQCFCPDEMRVILHSPGSVAESDPARRESVAYVSTALAADRAHFRLTVLEAMTLALLSNFDRHPIHAAAITRRGQAVLLAAPSGTGKSTLAYAAHVAGLGVLAEDHVWVQLTPALRIWGWPGRVHLRPEVASIFPEVARLGAKSNENDGSKLAVDLEVSAETSGHYADRAVVCVVERHGTKPTLERLSPPALAEVLSRQLTSGFDRFPDRHAVVTRALTAGGGWRLTLSDDPREALPHLSKMLDES